MSIQTITRGVIEQVLKVWHSHCMSRWPLYEQTHSILYYCVPSRHYLVFYYTHNLCSKLPYRKRKLVIAFLLTTWSAQVLAYVWVHCDSEFWVLWFTHFEFIVDHKRIFWKLAKRLAWAHTTSIQSCMTNHGHALGLHICLVSQCIMHIQPKIFRQTRRDYIVGLPLTILLKPWLYDNISSPPPPPPPFLDRSNTYPI